MKIKFQEKKYDQIGMDEVFSILGTSPFDHRKKITKKLNDLQNIGKYGKVKVILDFVKWIRSNKEFKYYIEG